MKKYHLVLLFLFSHSLLMQAQDDYMAKIVDNACQCLSQIPDGEEMTKLNMGLCIINEATLYKEELKRDYNIDMTMIDVQGEELGRLVALEMITKCPEQMRRIAAMATEQKGNEADDTYLRAQGVVKTINQNEFVVFSVTTEDGRTSKFYWLTFVQSDNDLQNELESFEGKNVLIEYSLIEMYDPKLGEYRNYNIIETLNILK